MVKFEMKSHAQPTDRDLEMKSDFFKYLYLHIIWLCIIDTISAIFELICIPGKILEMWKYEKTAHQIHTLIPMARSQLRGTSTTSSLNWAFLELQIISVLYCKRPVWRSRYRAGGPPLKLSSPGALMSHGSAEPYSATSSMFYSVWLVCKMSKAAISRPYDGNNNVGNLANPQWPENNGAICLLGIGNANPAPSRRVSR